jgi:hypothetical protein
MSDLATLLTQFNDTKNQILSIDGLPCQCCRLRCAILNGLCSYDRPLSLQEVDDCVNHIQPAQCSKCQQMATLQATFTSQRQQVYDAINTTYSIQPEDNPFKI